jgi:hypothetical protein
VVPTEKGAEKWPVSFAERCQSFGKVQTESAHLKSHTSTWKLWGGFYIGA